MLCYATVGLATSNYNLNIEYIKLYFIAKTTLCCVKWRDGRHLGKWDIKSKKSGSDNWCIFIWRTSLPNFTL